MTELSERAKRMIQDLHREGHAYGNGCDCRLTEVDETDVLDDALHTFGPETIEAAADDDVAAILELRQWFRVPPLV